MAKRKVTRRATGGWVRGKRRNADVGEWSRIRIGLVAMINNHYEPGRISARTLAQAVGVSDRTVRRWLAGEDRPAPEDQERCRTWAAEQRERIAGRTRSHRERRR